MDNLKGYVAYTALNNYYKKYCKSKQFKKLFWQTKSSVRDKYAKIEKYCKTMCIPVDKYIQDLPAYLDVPPSKVKLSMYISNDNLEKYAKIYKTTWAPETIYYSNLNKLFVRAPRLIPCMYPDTAALLLDPNQPFDNWFRVIAVDNLRDERFKVYYPDFHRALDSNPYMIELLNTLGNTGMVNLDKLHDDVGVDTKLIHSLTTQQKE